MYKYIASVMAVLVTSTAFAGQLVGELEMLATEDGEILGIPIANGETYFFEVGYSTDAPEVPLISRIADRIDDQPYDNFFAKSYKADFLRVVVGEQSGEFADPIVSVQESEWITEIFQTSYWDVLAFDDIASGISLSAGSPGAYDHLMADGMLPDRRSDFTCFEYPQKIRPGACDTLSVPFFHGRIDSQDAIRSNGIAFDIAEVPEPTTNLLALFAVVFFLARQRHRHQS